jgi:hypothetical protein
VLLSTVSNLAIRVKALNSFETSATTHPTAQCCCDNPECRTVIDLARHIRVPASTLSGNAGTHGVAFLVVFDKQS